MIIHYIKMNYVSTCVKHGVHLLEYGQARVAALLRAAEVRLGRVHECERRA